MIFKNSEEKRNTAWRTVMTVSSVLIVIIAAFFIVKLFTDNPLEGTWVSETLLLWMALWIRKTRHLQSS